MTPINMETKNNDPIVQQTEMDSTPLNEVMGDNEIMGASDPRAMQQMPAQMYAAQQQYQTQLQQANYLRALQAQQAQQRENLQLASVVSYLRCSVSCVEFLNGRIGGLQARVKEGEEEVKECEEMGMRKGEGGGMGRVGG